MSKNNNELLPPIRSKNIFTDIYYFLICKPSEKTHLKFASEKEQQKYKYRILQRLGISVSDYYILNIHSIGVNVPANYIFQELMIWNGNATCWPNKLAKVEWVNDSIETIKIDLFGMKKIPMFYLNAIKIQKTPGALEQDNARYLLYKCSGGYPIGVFSMYVRTSIAGEVELDNSQLFLVVCFNFFGFQTLSKIPGIRSIWEFIHNRATSHILIRLKELCEWRFERIKLGKYLDNNT